MIWPFLVVAPVLIFNPSRNPVLAVLGLSMVAYLLCKYMIPLASPALIKIGLSGRDKLKADQKEVIPESLGFITGVVYILVIVLLTPFTLAENGLAAYLSGVLSIQSMIMLGFADDLFDLRWRHKFFMPAIAAIPMLVVYYVEGGSTHIVVPQVFQTWWLPSVINLGWLYYVYMAAVSIFATNCINIYAGVNGLEVGQTVVVASSLLLNDLIYLWRYFIQHTLGFEPVKTHVRSIFFVLPLLACSIALLQFNWFPARVFVGDTFCYFAGMVLAVAGILGHFTKTMLSLILPQIANFIYSLPQLFKIVPCPRHRMPLIDPETNKLLPSRANVSNVAKWKMVPLRFLAWMRLLKIWESDDGKTVEISNMTLINLALIHLGPVKETDLTKVLIMVQAISCGMALVMRHMLAGVLFGIDNL